MATTRRTDEPEPRHARPATTPEARENQLISLAYDLAEKRLRSGEATSQEVSHFLKMGSIREKKERERLDHENDLLQAKREMMESQKRIEETYANALAAMRSYSGAEPLERDDYDD